MDRHSMWRSQAYDGAVFGINQFAYQRWCYKMHEYITVNLCNADKPFPLAKVLHATKPIYCTADKG